MAGEEETVKVILCCFASQRLGWARPGARDSVGISHMSTGVQGLGPSSTSFPGAQERI